MERSPVPSAFSIAWRSPALLIAAAMVPLFWIAFFINAHNEENRAFEQAKSHTASVAQIFEENTERIFLGVDRSLRLLRMMWERSPSTFDLKSRTDDAELIAGGTLQIAIIGADGYMLQTTADYEGPRLYLGDREHFINVWAMPGDDLYIGKPVRGRATGKASIQLTRKLRDKNGNFAGVIVGSVDPDRIGQFFASAQLGDHGAIVLRNANHVILAARGLRTAAIGTEANTHRLTDALAKGPIGHYWGGGAVDGIGRLISYRKSSTLPLIFNVGMSEDTIFAEYWRQQHILFIILAVFTLALGIAAAVDIRRRLKLARTEHELHDMALRFKVATEHMSQGLAMFDKHSRLVAYNSKYLQMYGISPEALHPGISAEEMLQLRRTAGNFDDDPFAYMEALRARLAQGEDVEKVVHLSDGRAVLIDVCPKDDGGWVATHDDITERQRAEDELASVKNFLSNIVQNIPTPIAIRDVQTRKFILVNRAYEAFIGASQEEIIGGSLADLYDDEVATSAAEYDQQAIDGRDRVVTSEFPVNTRSNGRRLVTTSRIAVRDRHGKAQYIIAMIDDITERKRSEAKIAQLAHYDALTDLANRNLFRERIDEYLAGLQQDRTGFAVLLLDLDRFKAVNDAFGHQTGDRLLSEVAKRMLASIRDTDMAARLGGDEFALIVRAGSEPLADGAEKLAQRLINAIGAPYQIDGQTIVVGCSIGIALAPEHGDKSDELLKNGDLALYKSKESGRNCFHCYREELKAEADRRDALENDLRTAIWREEFELFYQPIIDIESGRVRAVEALMRWRHPTLGLIAPNHFIPLAEETGLIVQLGEWAMTRACQDAMQMPAGITVSVNLSPVQFSKSSVVDAVIMALVDSQLPPDRLELEITENVLLKETETNLDILRQLKNLGVSIALDDFGVGYSSLGYLTSFPFDKVKIDRSFVEKLDRAESKAVISSIVQLSHSLNLTTTAEGIETTAQLAEIKALGIELCQGYLFSRPMPLTDLDLTSTRLFTEAKTVAA
jgi:diguanylate cyclase (GGDEF)-like protein/PAS domain S-box-containing protein